MNAIILYCASEDTKRIARENEERKRQEKEEKRKRSLADLELHESLLETLASQACFETVAADGITQTKDHLLNIWNDYRKADEPERALRRKRLEDEIGDLQ